MWRQLEDFLEWAVLSRPRRRAVLPRHYRKVLHLQTDCQLARDPGHGNSPASACVSLSKAEVSPRVILQDWRCGSVGRALAEPWVQFPALDKLVIEVCACNPST